MLSEVYRLWCSLDRAGVELPRVHPRVNIPGSTSGPCLRVRLNPEGRVAGLDGVTPDDWSGLWTVVRTSEGSFPVIRVKQPLLSVPAGLVLWAELAEAKKAKDQRRRIRILQEAVSFAPDALLLKKTLDLIRRVRDEKAGELLACTDPCDPDFAALPEFARRFQLAAREPLTLLGEVGTQAVAGLLSGQSELLDVVEVLLLGKGAPIDDGSRPDINIQLAFCLDDERLYRRRLYSRHMREFVMQILPSEPDAGGRPAPTDGRAEALECAFIGVSKGLQHSAFPPVRLPLVAEKGVPLVSMFSEAACNRRYGLTDSSVVPVDKGMALQMAAALRWVTLDERRGVTWRGVASGKFEASSRGKVEKRDLLLVYVEDEPEIRAEFADFFGTDASTLQKQFDVETASVCEALEGLSKRKPQSQLNLILIRQASEGQVHVALAESVSVVELLHGAQRWQEGARNLPPIALPVPGSKGQKAELHRPRAPFPDQVVRLLSEDWVTNGTRSNKVEGIGLGQVLEVMLCKPGKWEPGARYLLDLTLRRTQSLLVGVFGALRTPDRRKWDDYGAAVRENALRSVSIMGILLSALDRQKETYMDSPTFLVGRLLSLADTLHLEYCKHVRGGDIPPQLIGNALMPVARDNPLAAVDRLGERLSVYKAWATKASGDDVGLAKWAVGQMGEVCRSLAEKPPSITTNEVDRAEIFLGYMASTKGSSGGTNG